ncbi:MAG: hypothetical protein ACI4C1_08720, partial [Lachnospiraceae bacterium]
MWTCPMCHMQNFNTWICKQCNFDETKNYLRYPSLIPYSMQIVSGASAPTLDSKTTLTAIIS